MAAADAGQFGTAPPPELRTAWRLQKWGDPWNKGWWYWPAGLIDKVTILDNVYQAMNRYAHASGSLVDWTKGNAGAWTVVTYILKLRSLKDAAEQISQQHERDTEQIFSDLIAVSQGDIAILHLYGIDKKPPEGKEITSGWIRRQFGLSSYQG